MYLKNIKTNSFWLMGVISSFVLSVLLVLSMLFVVEGVEYFNEDFENWTGSNIGSWEEKAAGANCSVGRDTTRKVTGFYGLKCIDNNPSGNGACLRKILSLDTAIYVRFYVYLVNGFFDEFGGGGTAELLNVVGSGSERLSFIADGNRRFRLVENVGWNVAYFQNAEEDRWYCIEIKAPLCTASATVEWWVDGNKQNSFTADFSSFGYWDKLQVGFGYVSSSAFVQTVYYDRVMVSDSYIGPIGTGGDFPPAVLIINPTSAATTVSDTVGIMVAVIDDNGVDRVEFYIDEVVKNIDTISPYIWNWDTAVESEGGHTVKAVVYDTINQTDQDEIGVTVHNGAGPAPNDYLWLHVDGKYIRTSNTADPPNEIFMPVGATWSLMFYGCIDGYWDTAAAWGKDNGCNTMRISHCSLPYPMTAYEQDEITGADVTYSIENWWAPAVEVLKKKQIYSYIDQHSYMIKYTDITPWDEAQIQTFVDHWVAIADYFKGEPWVLGYELCNEVQELDATLTREIYQQALAGIRQIDTRHILLIGNWNWCHAWSAEDTWASVNFRPDEPYNQAVFTFHEYPNAFDPYKKWADWEEPWSGILDRIQNTYNVPLFFTEFGAEVTARPATLEEVRQFEIDSINCCYDHRCGWSLWNLAGAPPDWKDATHRQVGTKVHDFADIWIPLAQSQGSPIPVPSGGGDQPPTVSITSPSNGAAVSGDINITVYANDDNGINRVEFYIDDVIKNTDTTSPYSYSWDTTGESEGIHTIKAIGYDTLGQTAEYQVSVTVDNDADPTVSITNPSNGAKVLDTVDITADASDNNSISRVEFYIDGVVKNTDTSSPYSYSWGTTVESEGTHIIKVIAYDDINQTGERQISVTVDNVDNPPTVSVTGPTEGATVIETVDITANVYDDNGIDRVELYISNILKDTDANAPYSFSWDTTGESNGAHIIKVIAYDTTSQTGAGEISVTVDNIIPEPFEKLKVYPNPFVPGASGSMKFAGLETDSALKIYTLSGRLVATLNEADFGGGEIIWSGKNKGGNYIASGLYIYVLVDEEGNKKTGKVVVK